MMLLLLLDAAEHLAGFFVAKLEHRGVVHRRYVLFGGQQVRQQVFVLLFARAAGLALKLLRAGLLCVLGLPALLRGRHLPRQHPGHGVVVAFLGFFDLLEQAFQMRVTGCFGRPVVFFCAKLFLVLQIL